jgi:tetratricopeptide (TPR) repeat protein
VKVINLDPTLLLLLVACLFIVTFGALSFFRREGLSAQFALEAALLTAVLVGIPSLFGRQINPYIFVILLYLVTMRSRLLVDLANTFASRDRYDTAFRLYGLSLALWPDATSRLIVLTNRGIAEMRNGQVDTAITTLQGVLSSESRSSLGRRYEAACHYTLGLAWEQKREEGKAVAEYNEAIEVMPGSPFGQAAAARLQRRRTRSTDDHGASDE